MSAPEFDITFSADGVITFNEQDIQTYPGGSDAPCLVHVDENIYNKADSLGVRDAIQAVCLPNNAAVPGKNCWIAGWYGSNELQENGFNILDTSTCSTYINPADTDARQDVFSVIVFVLVFPLLTCTTVTQII